MATLAFLTAGSAFAQTAILNVSYDVSRELYKEINPAFAASWKRQVGTDITVNQSHGGSSKQAGAVIGGLEADVITMNQAPDIDILVERGGLVATDWRKQFPHEATPYTTTSVFLVRKGNPKAIKDWNDLTRAGLQVIVPNPKTSGNGRYTYLAAWGYALDKTGSEAGARDFVSKLFANVPVLDGGGRGATTTFTQRDVGDVLVTFENEAILIARELGASKFDIVYPSLSIDAAAPVAVIQKVAAKRGTEKVAKAYLDFLYTPAGQEIIARHNFRPRDPEVLKKHAAKYPAIRTFSVEQKLGGWAAVKKAHFADGAIYDQITAKK
ncbi:MAG: sulfate ABC transporter substrate-binding protein [Betaproteobacteria bacterium HGW-Betaproteobacteria-4]|nr:MAG: sulfate ABC transporter substrate-binding protein [Betaproteobacteria bacterium HGW-Betaproteobacteria-4]